MATSDKMAPLITFQGLTLSRKAERYSQNLLAKETGVSRSHISDIESGKSMPALDVMVRLARPLKRKITDLFEVTWVNANSKEGEQGHEHHRT